MVIADCFGDVAVDSWYHDAVQWAAENSIVYGIGNSLFAPEKAISRQEMAVMLYRYAEAKGYEIPKNRDMPDFADLEQIDIWAETAAQKLSEAVILSGDGVNFKPKDTATRAEVAQMFKNFMQIILGK